MKKLLLVLAMSGCACLAQADTMSFITVLSSPVGSFNKLETADPSLPAYGKAVNFCTRVGNGGVVELKGTQTAVLGRTDVTGGGMYLSSGTTLGKTDQGKFSLNNITLKKGGNITGGRLFANTATVNNAASGKAVALHGETLTIAGAKTKKLDVANGNSYIEPKDGQESPSMVWCNEYQADFACKENSSYEQCKKQYVLKSGSGPCEPSAEYTVANQAQLQSFLASHEGSICRSWLSYDDEKFYPIIPYTCRRDLGAHQCFDAYKTEASTGYTEKKGFFSNTMLTPTPANCDGVVINGMPIAAVDINAYSYANERCLGGAHITEYVSYKHNSSLYSMSAGELIDVDPLTKKVVRIINTNKLQDFCDQLAQEKAPGEYVIFAAGYFTITNDYTSAGTGNFAYVWRTGVCSVIGYKYYTGSVKCCS